MAIVPNADVPPTSVSSVRKKTSSSRGIVSLILTQENLQLLIMHKIINLKFIYLFFLW